MNLVGRCVCVSLLFSHMNSLSSFDPASRIIFSVDLFVIFLLSFSLTARIFLFSKVADEL